MAAVYASLPCPAIPSSIDDDGDGDISRSEFVRNAMNSKFLFDMLAETKEQEAARKIAALF